MYLMCLGVVALAKPGCGVLALVDLWFHLHSERDRGAHLSAV